MNPSVSFVLPMRKSSQRVISKNTKIFAEIDGGLAKIKISQLLKTKFFEQLYVTTDDSQVLEIAESFSDSRIILDERPSYLCESTTRIEQLIEYIGNLVESDHIFWVHATSPFVTQQTYNRAWNYYVEHVCQTKIYDSLMSTLKIQQFIWSEIKNALINEHNYKTRWPQTQDLEPLYEINHAFYINERAHYSDRIGKKPMCFNLSKIEALDIDYDDDFEFAEMVYKFLDK
jgi:CMP-N-acetylneuraminic acid synthetase